MSLISMGCGSSPGQGTPGELGDGTFDYQCENRGDLKCSETDAVDTFEMSSDLGSGNNLPRAVAVGASFGVRYVGTVRNDGNELLVSIQPAHPDDEVSPGVFALMQPLEAAFMAVHADGSVVDFVVMTALEATELSVWHSQREVQSLTLRVGERAELTVAPRSDLGTLLAGALRYQWVSTRPSHVTIGLLNSDATEGEVLHRGDIEVLGMKEGTSVIRVWRGELEAAVNVEVVP